MILEENITCFNKKLSKGIFVKILKNTYRVGLTVFLILINVTQSYSQHTGSSDKNELPNVLFISIDDLNDWVGPLEGHNQVKTPYLDKIVKEGMLFKNAYCASPLCSPSRAALMTGVLPTSSGIYYNKQNWRESPELKNALTIPQYFREFGYYTAGAGKIFHNKWPDPVSWDNYWPGKTKHMPKDPVPDHNLNGIPNTGNFDWGPLNVPVDSMGDFKSVNWVIGELKKEHKKPFFLACGIYKPHLPWHVPQEFFDMYADVDINIPDTIKDDLHDVPAFAKGLARGFGDILDKNTPDRSTPSDHSIIQKHKAWEEATIGYMASVSFADFCVGKLIEGLKESGYYDNTIIVLWSDHGYHLGEKEHWRKETLWEEATKNVLFIKAPGITGKNTFSDWPVSLMDIYPTLTDICGLPPQKANEGNNLKELLLNPEMDWDKPVVTTYGYKNHAVRSKRYKYIQYRDGSEELYDHLVDPNEWHNLAGLTEYREVIHNHKQYIPRINKEPINY
jgi:arylsulfatase A-like enzyme